MSVEYRILHGQSLTIVNGLVLDETHTFYPTDIQPHLGGYGLEAFIAGLKGMVDSIKEKHPGVSQMGVCLYEDEIGLRFLRPMNEREQKAYDALRLKEKAAKQKSSAKAKEKQKKAALEFLRKNPEMAEEVLAELNAGTHR